MDMLLDVTLGNKLPDTEGKAWTYTMRERLECLNSLLDRSIGKPTQTIVETGDDTSKEVLATMQALLKVDKEGETAVDASVEPESNLNPIQIMSGRNPPIQAMRDKNG